MFMIFIKARLGTGDVLDIKVVVSLYICDNYMFDNDNVLA